MGSEMCIRDSPFGATRCRIGRKTTFLEGPKFWPYPGLACLAGLGLLGFPCLGSASLALPAPRNNSPAAFAGRAARSAAAAVAGAGKASEADPRRGKPIKPRPGEKADPHNDDEEVATTLRRSCNDPAHEVDFGPILCRFWSEHDPTCPGAKLFAVSSARASNLSLIHI